MEMLKFFRALKYTGAGLALSLVGFGAADAHHSFSMFDMRRDVPIEGTIVEFQWTNPHSWIEVDVVRPGGAIERWGIELGPPTVLSRNGWTRKILKPGDKVKVGVHPLRNGRPGGALSYIVTPDGRRLSQMPPMPEMPKP